MMSFLFDYMLAVQSSSNAIDAACSGDWLSDRALWAFAIFAAVLLVAALVRDDK
jgi:hypothetical protein